jgi:putative flippase GtrA
MPTGLGVDATWAVFFIPAAILLIWVVLDFWLIKDTPEEAGFAHLDTHDASSGHMHEEYSTRDLLKKVFCNPLMLMFAGVELTSGVLRNGIMQWYSVFAHDVKQVGAEGILANWGLLLCVFGIVGAFAFVIDVGSFNLLRYVGDVGPLTSKGIAALLGMTFAYFANRHWTWGDRERTSFRREYLLFFIVNGVALIIAESALFISHYVLGYQSVLADNISANGIGLLLGTSFRFYAYRRWVFPETVDAALVDDSTPPSKTSPNV